MCKTSTTTATATTRARSFYGIYRAPGESRPATPAELADFYASDRRREYIEILAFVDPADDVFLGALQPVPDIDGAIVDVGVQDVPAEVRGMLDSGMSIEDALFLVTILPTPPLTYSSGRGAWRSFVFDILHQLPVEREDYPTEDNLPPDEILWRIRDLRQLIALPLATRPTFPQ